MLNKLNLQLFAMDDEDEDNNPLSNFEDFVADDDETEDTELADEQDDEETETEPEEEPEEEPEQKPKTKKEDSKDNGKKMSKQEYAIVQTKKENKQLKELLASMNERLANIEKSESERSLERKKKDLVATYIDKGFDEDEAVARANDVIEKEVLKNDVDSLRQQLQELLSGQQNAFDTKVQAEQSLLYKQAKAKQSKVDVASTGSTTADEGFKMSQQQRKDWESIQKTPWGKTMSKKDFLKSWKESFGE